MFKRSGLVRNVRVDSLILSVIFLEVRLYYYWILMFDKWLILTRTEKSLASWPPYCTMHLRLIDLSICNWMIGHQDDDYFDCFGMKPLRCTAILLPPWFNVFYGNLHFRWIVTTSNKIVGSEVASIFVFGDYFDPILFLFFQGTLHSRSIFAV